MNAFLILAFLFFIGCLFGWFLELIFRRFFSRANKERRWINPGFLVGPYLPLYGSGLALLYLLANIKLPFFGSLLAERIVIFVVMAAAMTIIEYVTGLVFIKKMNVKLWDYSNEWGNVQGVICPKFSLAWAALGAVYYLFVHPYILQALAWLSNNLTFSFVIGFFFGVFVIDVGYSLNILGIVRRFAEEYDIVVHYDELKTQIRQNQKHSKEKIKFLFIFGAEQPILDCLKAYHNKLEQLSITSWPSSMKKKK